MELSFKEKYNEYKNLFENKLYSFLDNLTSPDPKIIEAMTYSVKVGGKRIRPVIMLSIADLLGLDISKVIPYAISLELIHTYSLIHDDLPAMDNDDYRRGNLTNHKVFGEGMAILAGDGLLNLAYENLFRNINDIYDINAARLISSYAGYSGMIAGQSLDIMNEKNCDFSEQMLIKIHENKTSKLLKVAFMIPSCLCGDKYIDEFRRLGEVLGLLFQLKDDILDQTSSLEILGKTVHKDDNEKKLTFVTLYGLDKANELLKRYYDESLKILQSLPKSQFLNDLAKYFFERIK